MNHWYWRAVDASHNMTIGHGSAISRQGMVEQVSTCLLYSPHIAAFAGQGIELIIEPPEGEG